MEYLNTAALFTCTVSQQVTNTGREKHATMHNTEESFSNMQLTTTNTHYFLNVTDASVILLTFLPAWFRMISRLPSKDTHDSHIPSSVMEKN